MIIDTMVMAYAMLGVPEFGEESLAALRAADEIAAPASVEAELLNVVWQWGLRGDNPQTVAAARLRRTRVITYDKKLLALFPNDTVTVREV
jgi:predicted nucleic acid-binding protein